MFEDVQIRLPVFTEVEAKGVEGLLCVFSRNFLLILTALKRLVWVDGVEPDPSGTNVGRGC